MRKNPKFTATLVGCGSFVWVRVSGSASVSGCEYLGVRLSRNASVLECESLGVRMSRCVSVSECDCLVVRVSHSASISECKCLRVRGSWSASVSKCECLGMQVFRSATVSTCIRCSALHRKLKLRVICRSSIILGCVFIFCILRLCCWNVHRAKSSCAGSVAWRLSAQVHPAFQDLTRHVPISTPRSPGFAFSCSC